MRYKFVLTTLISILFFSCEPSHKEVLTYHKNKKVKERYYLLDGVKDSTYSRWNSRGLLQYTGKYKRGKKHGKWTEYITRSSNYDYENTFYEMGKPAKGYYYQASAWDSTIKELESFITYVNGNKIEKQIIYRNSGLPASETWYKNGGIHGDMIIFFENGNKWKHTVLNNARKQSVTVFDEYEPGDTMEYHKLDNGIDTVLSIYYKNGKPYKTVKK